VHTHTRTHTRVCWLCLYCVKSSKTQVPKESIAKRQNTTKQVFTEQSTPGAVVVENVADPATFFESQEEWPFEMLCRALANDLFSPKWEIRHGACIGFREVLQGHARGAGRSIGVPSAHQNAENNAWLIDLAVRLLCVMALDRFGDFVSDQMVAPIRELSGQVLGTLAHQLEANSVFRVIESLLVLLQCRQWEVRHGGLLGVKYVVAVRSDLVANFLAQLVLPLTSALQDRDDDVRAVAADALLPLAASLAHVDAQTQGMVFSVLWDSLLVLDDLSASTARVLQLMVRLYDNSPAMLKRITDVLPQLVPRLWNFMRHASAAVRDSAMSLLEALALHSDAAWIHSVLAELLARVFECTVLELEDAIRDKAVRVWQLFVERVESSKLHAALQSNALQRWLKMITTPMNAVIESALFSARYPARVLAQSVVEMRVACCRELACLLRRWPALYQGQVDDMMRILVESKSGTQQLIGAMIVAEWSRANAETSQVIRNLLDANLNRLAVHDAHMFEEAQRVVESKMQSDYAVLRESLETTALWPQFAETSAKVATLSDAIALAGNVYPQCVLNVAADRREQLESRQRMLLISIGHAQVLQSTLARQVRGACAEALVLSNAELAKITPSISALTEVIKDEEDALLQQRAADALARFMHRCVARKPCPNDRILRNLCALVTGDSSFTPRVGSSSSSSSFADCEGEKNFVLARRGAVMAIQSCARVFADAPEQVNLLSLWSLVLGAADESPQFASFGESAKRQELSNALTLLRCVVAAVSAQHAQSTVADAVLAVLQRVFSLVCFAEGAVQHAVAECVAVYARHFTMQAVEVAVRCLLPWLGDKSVQARLGAALAVKAIIDTLDAEIVPYISLFIVPVLSRMSDQEESVRTSIARSFARLVQLMPLEKPDPVRGLSNELQEKRVRERRFLEQLLDGSKLDTYTLPIVIAGTLRKYQQEGVNWMGFLNKYNMHGILCDDMGLGKTLQTICVVASDNVLRQQRFAESENSEFEPLPSLVVCPSTLVGHWQNEFRKFCGDSVVVVAYQGSPSEKRQQRVEFERVNTAQTRSERCVVLVTSYETVRSEIEMFSSLVWNYCVLDEGHIIKNANTRTSQAVKRVRANHRLILSGTPIQNNVLEMWSLFDFLMPGYLGNEKQFNENFSKPIIASKDAKASSLAQESGMLALERLHRQVLPFVLRRVKEDVLDDLPPKIIQDRLCEMSELQRELYAKLSRSPDAGNALQLLGVLRKLCNHPKLVEPDSRGIDSIEHSPKLGALRELLLECGVGVDSQQADEKTGIQSAAANHRVLVFCQTKIMLDVISKDLFSTMPITFLRLDGDVKPAERFAIAQTFNQDPTIDVLLLTTQVGGLGLNLTGADTVIFYDHDWNPMKDLQAMDRCHRLGQTKVVTVYRLIMRDTLEEKIMSLQRFKQQISDMVVNADNSSMKTMDTNALLDLFTPGETASAQVAAKPDETGLAPGLTKALENLSELWDESQYSDAHDMDKFLQRFK
jgi:TATA-binding protein-associated factor